MKIFINYDNITIALNAAPYQSTYSIINQFVYDNNIPSNINNFYLDYKGIYLNNNFSLEKYNISENSTLSINYKKKGGSSFFSYAKKHKALIAISLIIAILPIFILPMGFIPLTANLIKIIIEKSTNTIGKYLVCTLGKVTMFKRMKGIIFIIKYLILILMIFVIITFPLILLCVTIKGHSITDDPKKMCKPLSAGNISGIVLTIVYVMSYMFFRGGDFVLMTIINLFKKVYILNTIINPILKGLLDLYDKLKYLPVFIIPFIGEYFVSYFKFLDIFLDFVRPVLASITNIGCKAHFDKNAFLKKLNVKMNKLNDDKNKESKGSESYKEPTKEKELPSFGIMDNPICKDDMVKCCSANNYKDIGDALVLLIENSLTASEIKSHNAYGPFLLFIEALYESALSLLISEDNLDEKNYEEKRIYLRKILEEKIDVIPVNLKDSIKHFLEKSNNNLVPQIKEQLEKVFPHKYNTTLINDIKYKLALLDQYMVDFSKEDGSKYTPGKSLFKTIFKIIFLDTFCNVVTTARTSEDVISKMGEMVEISDMLKGGAVSGLFTGFCYLITVIVLIICGIFNIY